MYTAFVNKNNELGRAYMKGIMEMNPAAVKKMYPDANFSMRVSYGNVKSYNPRDAVHYDYVCTAKGILKNMYPAIMNLIFLSKQIELLKKRDFGQYIDKAKNDLVVTALLLPMISPAVIPVRQLLMPMVIYWDLLLMATTKP
jgi:hypothetical protein